jgi:hypothetical protein
MSQGYGIKYIGENSSYPVSVTRQVLRPVTKEYCMSSNRCRSFARGDDVDIFPHIGRIVSAMKRIENK